MCGVSRRSFKITYKINRRLEIELRAQPGRDLNTVGECSAVPRGVREAQGGQQRRRRVANRQPGLTLFGDGKKPSASAASLIACLNGRNGNG